MDDAMSRIATTLRPAVLRSSHASITAPPDFAPTTLSPAIGVGLALLADAAACLAAPFLAALLIPGGPTFEPLTRIAALAVVFTLSAGVVAGVYRPTLLFRRGEQVAAVARAGIAALALMACSVLLLGGAGPLRPGWAVTSAALLLGGLASGRFVLALLMSRGPGQRCAPRAVIVGSGIAGTRLLRLLRRLDERSLRVVGIVDDQADLSEGLIDGVPLLGPVSQLFALLRRGVVDEVVLALPWSEERRILHLIDLLADYPVHVRLAPDLISYHFPRRVCTDFDGHPMLAVAERPISGWNSVVKRCEDYLIAVVAVGLFAIPMAAIALAIRLDSPGPILFRQRRTGFNNRDFEMLKFRTMHHHMAEPRIRAQTTRNDPRVTRVGALLRRTSLDELPQIFNVLRGEMSIVGPRPHAPGTRAGSRPFEQVFDRYAARHRVKPGLTGLAQVRGYRGETRTEDKLIRRVESDLEYIDTWSLWLDLSIMVRTLVIVLRMQNAY
jgi:Undecaprenyl-phosphate glucose phosphotransferase